MYRQTKLFTTSEVPIFQVFSDDRSVHSDEEKERIRSMLEGQVCARLFFVESHSHSITQGLVIQQVGTSTMFNGDEEIFAFARACSRLIQMGTQEWALTAGHEDKNAMIL